MFRKTVTMPWTRASIWFPVFLYVIRIPGPLYSQDLVPRFPLSVLEQEAVYAGDDTTGMFRLPGGFFVRNSVSVFVNGARVCDSLYTVDYAGKKIAFFRAPVSGDTIRVAYRAVPFRNTVRDTLLARLSAEGNANLPAGIIRITQPGRESAETANESSLIRRGSFTRSLQMGSGRGLSMYSGLRMELSGQVTRDLEVTASLTDQNTPLQPEGNTQTLQEIDKIFFRLKGKSFETTLGDYLLEYSGTSFGRYERRLQGVMGKANAMGQEVAVSAAMSQGQFCTNRFVGREGNQGPYQLTGNQGERDIIIIAGTERVWIDGQSMTRGETGDYIIEYGTGEITFTRRRLVTDASRIEVDFQYSNGRFKRGFYTMHSEGSSQGNVLSYKASFFREADNADSPFTFSLSDENLDTYRQFENNRNVKPERQSLGDVELSFQPKKYVNIRSEFAMSSFSNGEGESGTDRMRGKAWDIGLSLAPETLRLNGASLGKGNLSARWVNIAEDFQSMTRIRDVEYTRKWDIRETELGGEQTVEFSGSYAPVSFLELAGETGILTRAGDDRNRRLAFRGKIEKENYPFVWYQAEQIRRSFGLDNSNGLWLRQMGRIRYTRKGITPELSYESEKKTNREVHPALRGFQFEDAGGQLSYQKGRKLTGRIGYRVRDEEDQENGGFVPRGKAKTANFAIEFYPNASFRNTVELITRRKNFENGNPDINTNLVDYAGALVRRDRGIQLQGNFQMSQEQLPLKEKIYLEVEDGLGNYRYDEEHNEYVQVERGNYLLRYLLTDTYTGVRGSRIGTTMDIRWARLFSSGKAASPTGKFWEGFRTRSIFRLDNKGKLGGGGNALSFSSSASLDTSTYFGNRSFLQEVYLFENRSDFTVRWRYNYQNLLNNQYRNEGERRRSGEQGLRLQWNLSRQWGVETDVTSKKLERLYQTSTYLRRDIISRRIDMDIFFRPSHTIEYSLQFHGGREENRAAADNTKINIAGITPGFRYSITEKGRLQGRIDWYNVTANTRIKVLPYEMADGRNVGNTVEWRVNFEYQIAEHIASNFEYRGEDGRWGLLHIGRAELRAFF